MSMRVAVEQFTTPDPITATVTTMVDDLWRLMEQHGVRHLPITCDGEVVGVVSDRDVRVVLGLSSAEKMQVQAADVMSPEPVVVKTGTPLDDVADLMAQKKVGSVIVIDDEGNLVGIFTATDALNALVALVRKGE